MRIIFVRRGQFSTFNVLVERCRLLADVDVQWDRRLGDDRRYTRAAIPSERRAGDRRKVSVPDVDLRGYTVVDVVDTPDSVVRK
jgi:hypothetical protein